MRRYQVNITINKSFRKEKKGILKGEEIEQCVLIEKYIFKAESHRAAKAQATRLSNKCEGLLKWLNEDNIKYGYPLEVKMEWQGWKPTTKDIEKYYNNGYFTSEDKTKHYVYRRSRENFKTNTYAAMHLVWKVEKEPKEND